MTGNRGTAKNNGVSSLGFQVSSWKKTSIRQSAIGSMLNQSIVVGMRTNPKPSDDGTIQDAESAIAEPDADGINVVLLIHLFKAQARMVWIGAKESVGSARLGLNFFR